MLPTWAVTSISITLGPMLSGMLLAVPQVAELDPPALLCTWRVAYVSLQAGAIFRLVVVDDTPAL